MEDRALTEVRPRDAAAAVRAPRGADDITQEIIRDVMTSMRHEELTAFPGMRALTETGCQQFLADPKRIAVLSVAATDVRAPPAPRSGTTTRRAGTSGS